MKRRILPLAAVTASLLLLILVGCSPEPTKLATLEVYLGGGTAPGATVGHTLYCKVYEQGASIATDPVLGQNLFVIPANGPSSATMLDPSSGQPWVGVDKQTYDVYIWVDVNDNYPTPNTPETGIDYQTVPYPKHVAVLAASSVPGWTYVIDYLGPTP
jgi:hypothetical protein